MVKAKFLTESGFYLSNKKIQTSFQLPDGANPLSVKSYANHISKGPSQDHPLLSWSHLISHPWNVVFVQILTLKFCDFAIQNGLSKLLQLLKSSEFSQQASMSSFLNELGDLEKLITKNIGYQQTSFTLQCTTFIQCMRRQKLRLGAIY